MRRDREKRLLLSRMRILLFLFIALGGKKSDKQKFAHKKRRKESKYERERAAAGSEAKMNEVNIDAT